MALSTVTRTTRRTMPGVMAGKADATATDPPGSPLTPLLRRSTLVAQLSGKQHPAPIVSTRLPPRASQNAGSAPC
jgi:hypothetical protein